MQVMGGGGVLNALKSWPGSIFFYLQKDSLEGWILTECDPSNMMSDAHMLVNATLEAFKSAAVHEGHVAIEQALTNTPTVSCFSY